MMYGLIPEALFLLSLSLATEINAHAASCGYGGNCHKKGTRLAGGAIAGIVIGAIAFVIFLCLCCAACCHRHGVVGAGGTDGLSFGNRFGYGRSSAQEAGHDGGVRSGWNNNVIPTSNTYGRYQPPAGPQPNTDYANTSDVHPPPAYTPQPGRFAPPPGPPPAAHTV
ncbi:hypothetical protein AcV7_003013 [Taiwanofungus camphoratus]|nr:hypothetical protein AcV7_003013 [Antrodia cinnamomea]